MPSQNQFDAAYGVRNDGQIHLEPLNLDAMNRDELLVAADHPALHLDVRHYAALKAIAIGQRLAGNIEAALRFERATDNIYDNDIPEVCKW